MNETEKPSAAKPRGFLERAIKAWGRDSADTPEKPHRCTIGRITCTVGRKFWFSGSGRCMMAGVVGREKKRAEERCRGNSGSCGEVAGTKVKGT